MPSDAVVILMSDHGPEFGLDWYDGAASDLRTRFGAFFAARSSSVEYPSDVIVSEALLTALRELGHTPLPRLEDRYFVTGAYDKLATLREIPDPWTGD